MRRMHVSHVFLRWGVPVDQNSVLLPLVCVLDVEEHVAVVVCFVLLPYVKAGYNAALDPFPCTHSLVGKCR